MYLSGSIEPITLIWVSLEGSFLPADDANFGQVMTLNRICEMNARFTRPANTQIVRLEVTVDSVHRLDDCECRENSASEIAG